MECRAKPGPQLFAYGIVDRALLRRALGLRAARGSAALGARFAHEPGQAPPARSRLARPRLDALAHLDPRVPGRPILRPLLSAVRPAARDLGRSWGGRSGASLWAVSPANPCGGGARAAPARHGILDHRHRPGPRRT